MNAPRWAPMPSFSWRPRHPRRRRQRRPANLARRDSQMEWQPERRRAGTVFLGRVL
jgi:hypothetical protein